MHVLLRLLRVNAILWGHLLWLGAVRAGLWRARTPPARRLVEVLERLGTTFVKLGQGLSLHRELLSSDYVEALQKLHDHVEPFDAAQSQAEIEASFGKPVARLFATFEVQPLAAGSVAQVHCATMPDGRRVIVKVRRPGIRRQVREDVRILRWFLRSVLWLQPSLHSMRPMELIDELARNLEREIDFRQEAANIKRFAEVFAQWTTVYVPGVVERLYTEWVLVQEMSPGRRIDEPRAPQAGHELATRLVDAYLHQLFVVGVFHGDPHPGNLFVLDDGRICFHDFGLVGYLDHATRTSLVAVMLAFVRQDGQWLLDASLELGLLSHGIDRLRVRAGLEELMGEYARKPLKDWSLGEVFMQISRLGGMRNVRLPNHLLVLMRAMFLLESTVRALDPEFNLVDGLFAKAGSMLHVGGTEPETTPDRLGYESWISLQQVPERIGRLLHLMGSEGMELSVKHRGLETLHKEVQRGSERIALALVTVGLYGGASMLMQPASIGPRWGDMPVLALLGYAMAAWFTWRLSRKGSTP